jgi:hypothetical protein
MSIHKIKIINVNKKEVSDDEWIPKTRMAT